MQEQKTITKDMLISQVLELDERLSDVLAGFGMHCCSCPMHAFETLEDSAAVHEIDIDFMIEKLNDEYHKLQQK